MHRLSNTQSKTVQVISNQCMALQANQIVDPACSVLAATQHKAQWGNKAWEWQSGRASLSQPFLCTCRYVQEDDLLALALNGRSRQQELPMLCQKPPPSLKGNVQAAHQPPPVITDGTYLEWVTHQG